MIRQDDRTDEQQITHPILWVGTDAFMSGWGQASDGPSVAAWACTSDDDGACERWVRSRSDMRRVRQVLDRPGDRYRPKGAAHLHIYVYRGQ